jgi:hypothetical protein
MSFIAVESLSSRAWAARLLGKVQVQGEMVEHCNATEGKLAG